ncbi:hypothetical protein [Candidatus Fukatsuia endosymbiont of Tuberolachnus salignus]|uniref:hypothetical protein n=1 Tax=Candidatus Fukatsuia endosymbiont of Tuberolachnus salignus TaxID=3077957 RepID=UPI00313E2210
MNIERLTKGLYCKELGKRQRDMHRQAGTYGKPVDQFTPQDFKNLTRAAERCSIGNCADLCMIAAREIVESGYPHPIELCTIEGKVEGFTLDHAFLRIYCDPKDQDAENCIIDPFMQMLSKPQRTKLVGMNQPITFEEPEYEKYLFCYAIHQETDTAQLVPMSRINNLGIHSIGKIFLDPKREFQFTH